MTWALAPRAQDVQSLGDEALRELIIHLATAELIAAGEPTSALLAGGNQTAPDGGIDVRVEAGGAALPYMPARPLGFQVKAERMPAGEITKEMRPKGKPRPIFADLAVRGGAYVIASGRDNCSDAQIRAREAAMRKALADVPGGADLRVAFYDADRLARWAAGHPGVSLWLGAAIGAPRDGWRGYGPWAAPNLGDDGGYLDDPAERVTLSDDEAAVSVGDALTRLATHLAAPRAVARLVGLSGMGKTRLAQALFEERDSAKPGLPNTLAVYGDAGAALGMAPGLLAAQLAERGVRAILVVDNCNSELHRRLAEVVMGARGQLSLLTIDFDVGPDRPPDTLVVRLDPAGHDLIERLLARRYPRLSFPNRLRIAEFAGGNSRIALALAAATQGVALEQLNDRDLLDRLFLAGRRTMDDGLRATARALALFGAIDMVASGDLAELPTLGKMANLDSFTLHAKVAELLERGLAQKRGAQRAVLPQALALRLADDALLGLPPDLLTTAVLDEAPDRLQKSFLRRLGALGQNAVARGLAETLIRPGGRLAPTNLTDREPWDRFAFLAPLAPDQALEVLDTAVAGADVHDEHFRYMVSDRLGKLLIALAFDDSRFVQATLAVAKLLAHIPNPAGVSAHHKDFLCLFQANKSGTRATIATRLEAAERLLATVDPRDRDLGVDALCAALRTTFERPAHLESFGDRLPDAGWCPRATEEWRDWYGSSLAAVDRALTAPDLAQRLRPKLPELLAEMLRYEETRALAIAAFRRVAGPEFWRAGWAAVSRRLHHFGQRADGPPPPEIVALEVEMRPASFADRVEAWVLGDPNGYLDAAPERPGGWEAFAEQGRALGAEIAVSPAAFDYLLSLAVGNRHALSQSAGEGLGAAVADLDATWRRLTAALEAVHPDNQNPLMLAGYVEAAAKREPGRVAQWLDAATDSATLSRWAVQLNCAAGPPEAAEGRRILAAQRAGALSADALQSLQYARRTYRIPDPILGELLRGLLGNADGAAVAASLLAMRYHGGQEAPFGPDLVEVGRHVLTALADLGSKALRGSDVVLIAKVCLDGRAGAAAARRVAHKMMAAAEDEFDGGWGDNLPSLIFQRFPEIGLDVFLGRHPPRASYRLDYILGGRDDDDHPDERPLSGVPDEVLKAWVLRAPQVRAVRVAHYVAYYTLHEGVFRWTPMAIWLLDLRDAGDVGEVFSNRFYVGSWSGSTVSRYVRRLALTEALMGHRNPELATWARIQHQKMQDTIQEIETSERSASERFE